MAQVSDMTYQLRKGQQYLCNLHEGDFVGQVLNVHDCSITVKVIHPLPNCDYRSGQVIKLIGSHSDIHFYAPVFGMVIDPETATKRVFAYLLNKGETGLVDLAKKNPRATTIVYSKYGDMEWLWQTDGRWPVSVFVPVFGEKAHQH